MGIDIKNILDSVLDSSVYVYGFADMRGFLPEKYARFTSGISIARKLDDKVIDGITGGPTAEYLELYRSVNSELSGVLEVLERRFAEAGLHALGVKATLLDTHIDGKFSETLRYDISHKMIATRAGLGWVGKTDLLVTKRFGPRVRLASLVVEELLEGFGVPIVESQCGGCGVCVAACPAKAANGKLWNINTDRDEFFDPFKCRENCRHLSRTRLGVEMSLCGLCVALCPRGKKKEK